MNASRRGTLLIIVAAISALLAALALTFLARMRSDVEESQAIVQYAQAKIMLAAACNYVQETSRIGWDRYPLKSSGASPSTPIVDGLHIHEEAYGWVDERDGSVGPLNRAKQPLADLTQGGKWPAIGTWVRCPMYVMKRPPYATALTACYNPMNRDSTSADFCWPLLKYPDPQPVTSNGWTKTGGPGSVSNARYAEFEAGDRTPRPQTVGKAWFRVYRDGPGTFVVTCGSGGSMGFRDWATEVVPQGQTDLFGGTAGKAMFDDLRATEIRLWYRIEWTAASTEVSYHNLDHDFGQTWEHYESWPPNASHTWSGAVRTQTWMKNPVGTIRWIQRLMTEPTYW
jgi:hypothetical protein